MSHEGGGESGNDRIKKRKYFGIGLGIGLVLAGVVTFNKPARDVALDLGSNVVPTLALLKEPEFYNELSPEYRQLYNDLNQQKRADLIGEAKKNQSPRTTDKPDSYETSFKPSFEICLRYFEQQIKSQVFTPPNDFETGNISKELQQIFDHNLEGSHSRKINFTPSVGNAVLALAMAYSPEQLKRIMGEKNRFQTGAYSVIQTDANDANEIQAHINKIQTELQNKYKGAKVIVLETKNTKTSQNNVVLLVTRFAQN